MADKPRRGTRPPRARTREDEPTDEQLREAFLDALRRTGVVLLACRGSGASRTSVYRWRARDEAFRAAWLDAIEEHTDVLEAAAIHRALHGSPDGSRPPSDRLLEKLLAARRPQVYGDRLAMQHSGRVDSDVRQTVTVRHPDADVAAAIDDVYGAMAESGASRLADQALRVDPSNPAVAEAASRLVRTMIAKGVGAAIPNDDAHGWPRYGPDLG